MGRPLAESCLYTILHPDALAHAAQLRGPSTFVVKQRMVTAEALFETAQKAGRDFAVLFGDAADCTRLIYRGRLAAVSLPPEADDTHYTVDSVTPLPPGHSPQELVLESTGETIAPSFIRPYAICRTPSFLV